MKALILDAEKRTANVRDIPKPTPTNNEILVKVAAIALNPVDSLYSRNPLGSSGRVVGTDFAGTIASFGGDVPDSSGLTIDQRVAGFVQGACSVNERPGAGAEYVAVPWDLVWKVPKSMSLEEAAGVSLTSLTAAQALFYRLGLPAPFTWEGPEEPAALDKENLDFFIYGATTSVGLYAAQLLRLSAAAHGRAVHLIGAASPKNHEMLRAAPYNYNELVDYHDIEWPAQVKGLASAGVVDYAYDTISEGRSVIKSARTLRPHGKLAIVRSRAAGAWKHEEFEDATRPMIPEPIYGAVWEGLGFAIEYSGFTVPASPKARAFAVEFYKWLSTGGDLKPTPIRLMPGGLDRVVEDGFALLGPGVMQDKAKERNEEWMRPISGEKLVYQIST